MGNQGGQAGQKPIVVKIQRPLSDPAGPWMIYDQGRSFVGLLAADDVPRGLRRAMRSDCRAFFLAELSPGAAPVVLGRVPDEDW
jgi:hypothetical protein